MRCLSNSCRRRSSSARTRSHSFRIAAALIKPAISSPSCSSSLFRLPFAEFDFRWNNRKIDDGERTAIAIRQADRKRLLFKKLVATPVP
jgi:hypothetical protein